MKNSTQNANQRSVKRALYYGCGLLAIAGAGLSYFNRQDGQVGMEVPAQASTTLVKTRSSQESAVKSDHASHAAEHQSSQCGCASCQTPEQKALVKKEPIFQEDVQEIFNQYAKSDRLMKKDAFQTLKVAEIGKKVRFQAGGVEWSGVVDSRKESQEIYLVGVTLDDQLGRFQASVREDGKVLAQFLFTGENQALAINSVSDKGEWEIKPTVLEDILCTKVGAVYQPAEKVVTTTAVKAAAAAAQVVVPKLNSRPESKYVLYCDFDGEVVTSPVWNGGQTIDAPPLEKASEAGFIAKEWRRAAEDFAPFDINVTTDRAVFDATPVSQRVHCVMTTNNAAAPGAGGVAMLGSFGADMPCWCFNDNEGSVSETISHETGHTLGLRHDGIRGGEEYYGGHGSGISSWAPIMGANFADRLERPVIEEISSWSKGEYPGASNIEDDLAIIVSNNGFGYIRDDAGDSRGGAVKLSIVDGNFYQKGIIERNTDTDWYSFATRGGTLRLNARVVNFATEELPTRGSNMAISCELYDSNGKLLQTSNREDSLDASLNATLPPGTFYVKIDGVGRGTLANGFPNYGALGTYTITGSAPLADMIVVSPSALNFPASGGSGQFNISSSDTWSWSCDAPWVKSVESIHQAGNQLFEYTVDANEIYAGRQARITITNSSRVSTVHTVFQAARVPDDHADVMADGTNVQIPSEIPSRFNFDSDVDWFRVELTQQGNLIAYTSGSSDTLGELYDVDGRLLARSDNADKKNFKIVQPLAPGVYYVKVSTPVAYDINNADYVMHVDFISADALVVDPTTRSVSPVSAEHTLDVTCSGNWSWTIWIYDGSTWTQQSNDWLQTTEPVNQSQSQRFSYTVADNVNNVSRKAQIRFTSGTQTAVHEVVQLGSDSDDVGNTPDTSKLIGLNASMTGVIETEGDVDVYQVELTKIGQLRVGTEGMLDTYGELCDQDGNVLASNDDANGINFEIVQSLMPGRYFIKVRHYNSVGTGAYSLYTSFSAPAAVTLTYKVDRLQGAISGTAIQKLRPGMSGRKVTAVPRSGYAFVGWSDGLMTPSRIDYRVMADLTVTAQFKRLLQVAVTDGVELVDNNLSQPVRFATVGAGEPSVMQFTLTNLGTRTLTRMNVTRFGVNASEWTVTLPKTSLAPKESMVITATFKSNELGYRSAVLTVNASGNPLPFRIPVLGLVQGIDAGKADGVTEEGTVGSAVTVPVIPSEGGVAPIEGGFTAGGEVGEQSLLDVDAEGMVVYHFSAEDADKLPEFLASKDAQAWVVAQVVEVKKVKVGPVLTEYQVKLNVKELDASVVLVKTSKIETQK